LTNGLTSLKKKLTGFFKPKADDAEHK
jgi:hypothetical protein